MEFSRQEHWSGLPFPTPGEPADPGIKSMSLVSPALAGILFIAASSGEPYFIFLIAISILEKYPIDVLVQG